MTTVRMKLFRCMWQSSDCEQAPWLDGEQERGTRRYCTQIASDDTVCQWICRSSPQFAPTKQGTLQGYGPDGRVYESDAPQMQRGLLLHAHQPARSATHTSLSEFSWPIPNASHVKGCLPTHSERDWTEKTFFNPNSCKTVRSSWISERPGAGGRCGRRDNRPLAFGSESVEPT